jgi:hypothetical protein
MEKITSSSHSKATLSRNLEKYRNNAEKYWTTVSGYYEIEVVPGKDGMTSSLMKIDGTSFIKQRSK